MTRLKVTIAAAVALCGAGLAGSASAMPINDLHLATAQAPDAVQKVAWVCGPFRCWWRPNWYYGYGFYRPYGVWGGPWWWRRHFAWHRW
jgi:hypothetical protein